MEEHNPAEKSICLFFHKYGRIVSCFVDQASVAESRIKRIDD